MNALKCALFAGVIVTILVACGLCAVPEVVAKLEVSSVWSGHPVGFCLLTDPPHQYAAYYDAQRRMTVAYRKLDEPKWRYQVLDSTLGWDSHNFVTMAIDEAGFLHLAGNMHCVPLVYFRSEQPHDTSTLRRIERMTGQQEKRVTYPVFIRGANGELIFRYRDGGSGNGSEIYNVYDVKTQTWRRLLDVPLTDGRGKMNAYPKGPVRGPDGLFHLTWIWRNTPDCATNHDLSYARSVDMVEWQTVDGQKVHLPMTIDTAGVIVDPIPTNAGLINGTGSIGFDSGGRVLIAYHKFDSDGYTQAYVARWEDSAWSIRQVSDWKWRWDFSGGGSINFDIVLGAVTLEPDGGLGLSYRHKEYGSGVWRLDEQTLKPVGRIQRPATIPRQLGRLESVFPGMQVRWAHDAGKAPSGFKYVLRWETLDRNRDRPRQGLLPEPSMLTLYKLSTPLDGG